MPAETALTKEIDARNKNLADERNNVEARKALQIELLQASSEILGNITGLFKQGSAAQKVAAITEIGINTALGYIQGLDIAQKGAKATGPLAPYTFPIFYASQVLSILGAVAKAKDILSQSDNSSSSPGGIASAAPSIPAPPSIPSMGAPIINTQTANNPATQIGQTIQSANQQPIRAYVVSGDISTQQQLDRKVNRGATFGLG